jgi:hypothetical protein
MPRPHFTLGKTWYPLYRRLGGPQGWSGQVRKISPPLGFDPRTVQPIGSRYTNYATQLMDMFHIEFYPNWVANIDIMVIISFSAIVKYGFTLPVFTELTVSQLHRTEFHT